jgi:hypothetical protein
MMKTLFAWVAEEAGKKYRSGQSMMIIRNLKYLKKLLNGEEILIKKKDILFKFPFIDANRFTNVKRTRTT